MSSVDPALFPDRDAAADRLVALLEDLRGKRPLVLAIPRGAVPMGRRIADALGGDLDLALVKKIGHPHHAEFAIAAVDERGEILVEPGPVSAEIAPGYLEAEARRIGADLQAARERYAPGRPPVEIAGRDVVVLDDGIATGATMLAAVRAVRRRRPRSVLAVAPVASAEAGELLRRAGVTLRALRVPRRFGAVARFYVAFPPVEDADVRCALGSSTKKVEPRSSSLST